MRTVAEVGGAAHLGSGYRTVRRPSAAGGVGPAGSFHPGRGKWQV